MGFNSASVSFTRFRIIDDIPAGLWADIPARLRQFAFMDIDALPDERAFGWVNFDDMLDEAWRVSPPEKGHYLTFSLRLDTRRVPPAVLKKHCTLALREEEEKARQQGQKFVSRARKKELRELVKARLLARTLPIPAEFNVIWNRDSNIVYFSSVQTQMISMFTELFAKTFELDLEELTPYALAEHLAGENISAKLDSLAATAFV
ncbi:MAG: recombination-associated protein RdgC [Desulfovibrionaceae bacterium]|nr:recombination-associated protein RdgC [Desulfovibrionaceae bacterium]